jgi:Protein of unknown function (DUF2934)
MRAPLSKPKVQKQPKLNKAVASKHSKPAEATETTTLGIGVSEDTIRVRAFQVYQSRGGQHGNDVEDWLHAEQLILER